MNVQKKLIRLIAFKPYTEHTKPIFRQLEILNIEQIKLFFNYFIHVSISSIRKFAWNIQKLF